MQKTHDAASSHESKGHYGRLLVMIGLSFLAMYALMYAMVDRFDNVYANWNQLYMAGLMTSAMVLIELAVMLGMYQDKKLNALIAGAGIVALIVFWFFIRRQTAISNEQFLKSMIPHHASAILMCQRAPITDSAVRNLCRRTGGIVESQTAEIAQMKAMLEKAGR
jgi:DUF305 family protein family protein